ncbi:PDGLE domain-containing protein [Peptococcaceae bacterium 1198_IL3148]
MPRIRLFLTVLIILLVAGVLSNFASTFPDGLERVAEDLGFMGAAKNHTAIFQDYSIPGITYSNLAGGLAGILGCVMVYILIYGFAKIIKCKTSL